MGESREMPKGGFFWAFLAAGLLVAGTIGIYSYYVWNQRRRDANEEDRLPLFV